MKKIIFLFIALITFAFKPLPRPVVLNFTQLTTEYARPFAGPEKWYGQWTVPTGFPDPIDDYWRFLWREIATDNDGVYNFSVFDQMMDNFAPLGSGKKFNFAIMIMDDYYGGNPVVDGGKLYYPTPTHKKIQTEALKDFIYTNGSYWPPFNSPNLIHDYTDMYAKLSQHLTATGRMPRIGYVEMACYGNSGEWTSSDPVVGTVRAATTTSLKALCQGIMNAFPDKYCVILCSAFDGMQVANTRIPADFGRWALEAKTNAGPLGWTKKSWGDNSWWNTAWTYKNPIVMPDGFRFDTAIINRSRRAPVTGEPSNFPNAANPGPFADLDNEVTQCNESSLGNGNLEGSLINNPVGYANLQAAFKKMGARVTLTGGNITGNQIVLNWTNKGNSSVYEDYDGVFELRNSSGTVLFSQKSGFRIKWFMGSVSSTDNITGSGTGDLYLILTDPMGVRKPYPLGITGRNTDGSYKIASNITFGGSGPIPPPDSPVIPVPPVYCDTIVKVTHDTTYKVTRDSLVHRVCPPPVGSTLTVFTTQFPLAVVDNDQKGGDEKGVKFVSSINGTIKAVRYYRKAGMNGLHIGELYSKDGTKLAQAPFTNETASGWQTAVFLTPVQVTAGQSYTAAVFFTDGNYLEENDYFKGKGVVNGTLSAPADGTSGASGKDPGSGQGVYIYSTVPAFPNTLYRSANYWIDVVF